MNSESKEFIDKIMDSFEPLSEDEQRLVLRLFIDMYCEMAEKLNSGKYDDEDILMSNMSNYQLVTTLLTKEKKVKGLDSPKRFLLKQAKKMMEESEIPKA